MREDHSQVRKGNAPQVVAALNNLVLAVFDLLGVQNAPKQMRLFDAQPQQEVRLFFGSWLAFRQPKKGVPCSLTRYFWKAYATKAIKETSHPQRVVMKACRTTTHDSARVGSLGYTKQELLERQKRNV